MTSTAWTTNKENTIEKLQLHYKSVTLNIKQIISISTFNSSQPNTWTEQGSLQNAQAFGLLASYKDNLVHIGGRDPFSGVSLPLESKTGGDWEIWASLSGEITQYLSGCRRMNQERICTFANFAIRRKSARFQ